MFYIHFHHMKKEVKIILYCVLGIILILVLCLTIWWRKHSAWEPDINPNIEPWILWQEINEENYIEEQHIEEQSSQTSEQDILNDLESLFSNTNWYENVEWDFWFIGSESN